MIYGFSATSTEILFALQKSLPKKQVNKSKTQRDIIDEIYNIKLWNSIILSADEYLYHAGTKPVS